MLTLAEIQDAYMNGFVGSRQPTAIYISSADWDSVRLRYSDFERHLRINGLPLDHLILNGIPLMRDHSLSDGSIMVVNDHPTDPSLNFTLLRENKGQRKLHHPDPEIERLANKHYQEDPETRRLVDKIFATGRVIEVPLEYKDK